MEKQFNTESNQTKLRLHFNLKQMRDKEMLTQIMLVTTVNKQRIRVYTKLRIEPKHWEKNLGRCKLDQPLNLRDKNRLSQINRQLNKLENILFQMDNRLAEKGKYLSHYDLKKSVQESLSSNEKQSNPISYLYKQVDEYEQNLNRKGKRGIASTKNTYYTVLKRLENFCKTHKYPIRTFEDFDNKFFSAFTDYLYNNTYQKGNEQKKYTQNTVINSLKVIKNLLHRAYDHELMENNYFQKVQTVLSSDACGKVYLEEKEIKKLANLKLSAPHEKRICDMFLISCYTALRISDIQQLNDADFHDGVISLYQTKTKEHVDIPILKEITSLISTYQQTGFPSINICQANQTIKELAKRCGITQTITYKEHRGGIVQIKKEPKWKLITFHTGRRSCITNLYKRGYPVNYIMTLSGHRSIQAFQRYMRASSTEVMNNFVNLLKKDKAL